MEKDMEYYIKISNEVMLKNLNSREALTKKLVPGFGKRPHLYHSFRLFIKCSDGGGIIYEPVYGKQCCCNEPYRVYRL